MSYTINLGQWNDIFVVPKSVVSKHLRLANQDYIKILLLILANPQNSFSDEDIAELCGILPENVSDGIRFWIDCGVLSLSDNELVPCSIKETDAPKPLPVQKIEEKVQEEKTLEISKNIKIKTKEAPRLTSFEVSQRINNTDELKWIMSETEKLFGRFLNQTETATLVSLFDYASIPADIIVMIIEYCVSIEKTNVRFIEKTAYSWIDQGIDTHQKVENHINSLITSRNNESLIKTAFGIWDRNLTTKQKEFVDVWLNQWEFSIEMIKIAYEMCIDNTDKISFPYINKILFNWFENNIKTPEQVKENEANRKKNDTVTSTFDASEFDDISNYTVPSLSKKQS